MRHRLLAPALLLFAALPAAAADDNCEAIRDQIEARVRGSGVQRFSLAVVDAAASAPGRVVGSCARGSRKILYTVAAGASGPAAARNASASPIRLHGPTSGLLPPMVSARRHQCSSRAGAARGRIVPRDDEPSP